ncbi:MULTISPECIES: hypothetical protein [Robertmurraya]|uniref:Tyr recombinase domain-containing protein n=1 Tax=Robertmurraya beringensis TaxID=641660 RepID=A0ABV6KLT9_9BACI
MGGKMFKGQMKYKYTVVEFATMDFFEGEIFKKQVIGIGLRDEKTNKIYPSPITNYIKGMYRRKSGSLSNQRNAASELTKFLNFIIKQVEKGHRDFLPLNEKGLFGLKLIHGSKYISLLSLRARAGKLDSNYVYRMEYYLINFFHWLNTQGIIDEPFNILEGSPFDDLELGTIYPPKDAGISSKLVDFGDNRYALAVRFINTAEKISPDIALGVAFQFFGGLRAGEVVNLTKDSLEKPTYWNGNDDGIRSFILRIRDNQELLFGHKKNHTHEQVKRPRNQYLLVNDVLSKVYRKHKVHLDSLTRKCEIKNEKALFVSSSNGHPISGKSYYEKFNKIKKEFLRQLSKEEQVEDYEYLTSKHWSTHICRGVFTNFLLEIGATVPEVAVARGDKNILSVLSYVEEQNAIKLTNEAINKIREAYTDKLAKIEESNIEKWKKEVKHGEN